MDDLVVAEQGLDGLRAGTPWPLAVLPEVEGSAHRLLLVERGDDALALRLHLIRSAALGYIAGQQNDGLFFARCCDQPRSVFHAVAMPASSAIRAGTE